MPLTVGKKLGSIGILAISMALPLFAAPQDGGLWSEPFESDWPVRLFGHHTLLTPEGKVLSIGGIAGEEFSDSFYQTIFHIWDPELGTGESSHKIISGAVPDIDKYTATLIPGTGNVLIAGSSDPSLSGSGINIGNFIFNTETNTVSNAADSAATGQLSYRTYTYSTILSNGEILVGARDVLPEIYSPMTDQWRTLSDAPVGDIGWLAPNGEVIISSPEGLSLLDTSGNGSVTVMGTETALQVYRGGLTNSVMYRPGEIFRSGGNVPFYSPSSRISKLDGREVIQREVNSTRSYPVLYSPYSILLPTGNVLLSSSRETNPRDSSSDTPPPSLEIWDAATETWSLMTELADAGLSEITLLRDGRILVLSSSGARTFSPPYLFNDSGSLADRPEVTSAPSESNYDSQIAVEYESTNKISRVTLVTMGRASDGRSIDQRFLELEFDDTTDGVNVHLPESANIAPPGYYFMYLIDDQGVPSEGHIISLNPSSPDSSAYPTASDDYATVAEGATVTIDVLANDTGKSLTLNPPNVWSLRAGNVALVDNKLTYTPKPGFTGEDNIWYTFVDAIGRVNSGKVTITVNTNNSSYPTASEDNVETITLKSTSINVLANDNGDGLVLHAPNAWSLKGGTVELVDNQLVYTSKADFVGNDNIWYVFEDSQGRTNSGKVNITVTNGSVSAYPVANSDSYTTSKGIGKNLDILDNDTGSGWIGIDTLYEYTANGGTTYKTPEGLVWYTPKAGFTGEDNFWYVMIDSEGRKNSAKVIITVRP